MLKEGKLSLENLNELLNIFSDKNNSKNFIGEDAATVNLGEHDLLISTDPITLSSNNIGKLLINVNSNDLAACGIKTFGMFITALFPVKTTFEEIKNIMCEIDKECQKFNIKVLGGHTEITSSVNRTILSGTAIGITQKNNAISSNNFNIDDDIIVTKYLGLEETSIIVSDNIENIRLFLTLEEIRQAEEYIQQISVIKEGLIGQKMKVNSMHDITEGGLNGSLAELFFNKDLEYILYNNEIPITDLTRKICKKIKLNPLNILSSGCMLIFCKKNKSDLLLKELNKNKIKASKIGKVIKKKL